MLPLMQPATGDSLINNIRAEMARRRVDQGDIARLLGLSRNAVSDRLRGRSRIQLDELQAIATFLQVPLEQLLAPADAEVPA
jgi:transcriptional regulator with XRE-family HTH domain